MNKEADGVMSLIWDDSAGPVENILGLVEYGLVFVPGWRLSTLIMTALGLGPKSFGKWIDNYFGLKDVKDVEAKLANPESAAKQILESAIEDVEKEASTVSLSSKTIKKSARLSLARSKFFRKILRNSGLLGMFARFLGGILKWAKVISLGGLGAVSLKGIHSLDEGEKDLSDKVSPDIPVSIKEKPNLVKQKLEDEVDKALSL